MEIKYSVETIEKELGKRYRAFEGAPRSFNAPDGTVFRVSSITKLESWVLEYAESKELAEKGLFGEDGDLFPMELSLDEVIAGMIEEIGASGASPTKSVTISPEWTVYTPAGSVIAITSEGNFKFDGSSWIHVSSDIVYGDEPLVSPEVFERLPKEISME